MPKIIDNVRERAIDEARKVLIGRGYRALTIRQIANELGIAPGTFYNYFPSKEYLAANVMLEDWHQLTQEFESGLCDQTPEQVFAGLFDLVRSFSLRFVPAWKEYEVHDSSRPMIHQYHGVLVQQLAGYLCRVIPTAQQEKEPWLADFLAEMILRFGSDSDADYDSILPAAEKLLRNVSSDGSVDKQI